MLLSYRHNYLFIANQKVASEAIHLVAGDDADLGLSRVGANKHVNLPELLDMVDEVGLDLPLDDLFVFSIVREPAEWYISWYNSRARPGLANPDHRRHQVYTGNVSFDEYIELALSDDKVPMTRVKAQHTFFNAPPGVEVVPLPFDRVSELFPKLFPADSSIAGFQLFKKEHHKNRSKVVRFTAADLTDDHREKINTRIWGRDYDLYLQACERADQLAPVTGGSAERAAATADALGSRPELSELAEETAFSIATTRLYAGESVEAVQADLARFQHVDVAGLLAQVAPRADRFRSE